MHIQKEMEFILAEQIMVYFSHVYLLSYLFSDHHQQLIYKYFRVF